MPRLTQEQLATYLDCSSRNVRDLLAAGVLPGRSGKGYDADACRVAYIRHLREQAAGRRGSGDLDLVQERARLARAQAEAREMKNAVERGELVHAIDHDYGYLSMWTTTSGRLQGVAAGVATRLAVESSPALCQEIVADAIGEALDDIATLGREAEARILAREGDDDVPPAPDAS